MPASASPKPKAAAPRARARSKSAGASPAAASASPKANNKPATSTTTTTTTTNEATGADSAATLGVVMSGVVGAGLGYGLDRLPSHDDKVVMAYSVTGIVVMLLGQAWWLSRHPELDKHGWLSLLMMWIMGLALTSSLLCFAVVGHGAFGGAAQYLEHGEKYFLSSSGFWILAWDGTAHVLVEALATFCLLTKRHHAPWTLLWAGSTIHSMTPLLMGAFTGSFSNEIRLSTGLNIPWVICPIAIAVHVSTTARPNRKEGKGDRVRSTSALADVVLIPLHVAVLVLHWTRAATYLGSKNAFVLSLGNVVSDPADATNVLRVQALQWAFWGAAFHIASLHEIVYRVATNRRGPLLGGVSVEVCLLALGAYSQGVAVAAGMGLTGDWKNYALEYPRANPMPAAYFLGLAVPLVCVVGQLLQWYVQDVVDVQ